MKRALAKFEKILAAEGMPAELPATPSWRRFRAKRRDRQRPALWLTHPMREVVELPADRDNHQQTVRDRADNFACDAEHVPAVMDRLAELYWRGAWQGFPAWHRALVWAVVQDGTTVAEFSRARRLEYLRVWRALEQHKRRAGIGDDVANENKQASRVEQTQAVRVKAVFSEKLDPHLGLGHLKYAEGELVMGGRFVKIEFPTDRPHEKHEHVLVPVGPGVTIAVLKD